MARIPQKNTSIELKIFSMLDDMNLEYEKHRRGLPGTPDIVFTDTRIAVFIDGDFWHGKNFFKNKKRLPKKYWREKIESNILRDKRNKAKLKKQGWTVLRIWEHEIKKNPNRAVDKIQKLIEK